MKTVTKKATAYQAHKKALATPIPYEYKYDKYESYEEVQAANDLLKNKEVVQAKNAARAASARAASLALALEAAGIVKPTIENDPQLRLMEMFKIFMATKNHTEETARAAASAALGIEWEDEDDD